MSAERWLAPASGAVMTVAFGGVLTVYMYGASQPAGFTAAGTVVVPAPPATVAALLTDLAARPTWRPEVARIARIDDDRDGRPVWRQLDASDDRFDLLVVELSPERVVFGTAAPEQVGIDTVWTYDLAPSDAGTRVRVQANGRMEQPLFRGLFLLRGAPRASVRAELLPLAAAFGSPDATIVWE